MDVLIAAVGVDGGAPPAKVEMVYCWAKATKLPDNNKQTPSGRRDFTRPLE
jgi:hypothetical protein